MSAIDLLKHDIEEILGRHFKASMRMTTYAPLTNRLSTVARIAAGPADRTFIVKHVPLASYAAPGDSGGSPEFMEEAAAYEFFSVLEPTFRERPERIGYHPRGLLVLEDMGSQQEIRTVEELSGIVGVLLARMHASTLGKKSVLDESRSRLGLSSQASDARYESHLTVHRRFESGARALAGWCEALRVPAYREVLGEFQEVQLSMERPEEFCAYIHDDLVNGRQCIIRGGEARLFDFENGKFAHALLDPAKTLVGKFERHLELNRMIFVCPGLSLRLLEVYRRELARLGGPEVNDASWSALSADAVLYVTACQVGTLLELTARTEVLGGLLSNVRALLARMTEVLDGNGARMGVRRALALVGARIVFGVLSGPA